MASRKIRELYDLVEGIETAMFTTRRRDGHLVSRPMATQKRSPGADFWFVTYKGAEKLDELAHDPHVNLSYYKDRTREWISVSGMAETSTSRRKIRELYEPDWKAWFGDEGGAKDGGPEDPRMILIKVKAREATFLDIKKPQPVVLFEVLRGMVTGKKPNLGRTRHAKASDFPRGGRKARAKGSRKARAGSKRPRSRSRRG